eukprot:scaffold6904_cov105-Isochrysis_galbana.AAC.3
MVLIVAAGMLAPPSTTGATLQGAQHVVQQLLLKADKAQGGGGGFASQPRPRVRVRYILVEARAEPAEVLTNHAAKHGARLGLALDGAQQQRVGWLVRVRSPHRVHLGGGDQRGAKGAQ